MAEQLNLLANDALGKDAHRIVPIALHQEMQRSYLEYAMSVIVGRALPDVRDGLKPVQRRILYAMYELGLTPDRPYRKCARVVGDVLGKYHPHGDQSVYEALVRLVQDFSCRYPLLDGHGNFGSVDNDPPAAMRYTEVRLDALSHEGLLGEIGEATVDFTDNFDNSQQEPIVLPAQLPILLLNGCSGIAVGMATNIPPHNLGEIVDGLMGLIDANEQQKDLTDEQLLKLIPGPDFPTGGEIMGTQGIQEAYREGKGSIPLRGVVQREEIQPGRGRHRRPALIITELPFQVNKAGWIEKVADLANNNKVQGIADIRDESDREGMRVVIELKREANPAQLLADLYQKTPLQINFGATLLGIVNGEPRQLGLKGLLQEFLRFREETLTRRYRYELEKAQSRLEIVAGLLIALEHLDGVIDILRHAPDGSTAKVQLQVRLDLSDRQGDAILAMPLRRLLGTERTSLEQEAQGLRDQIQSLERLLSDRHELLKSLKKDLRALKRKYGNPRRTRIYPEGTEPAIPLESESPEEDTATETLVEQTQRGYVRRFPPRSRRSKDSPSETGTADQSGQWQSLSDLEDWVIDQQVLQSNQELLIISRSAKAYTLAVADIPLQRRPGKGVPLVTLLPEELHGIPNPILWTTALPESCDGQDLMALTQGAKIKRLPLGDFQHLTQRGLILMKLKDEDELLWIDRFPCPSSGQPSFMVVATSSGRLLRFSVDDQQLPYQGRNTQGQTVLRLRLKEELVGGAMGTATDHLVLISEKGYGKRLRTGDLPLGCRGDLGNTAFHFSLKGDRLIALHTVQPHDQLLIISTQNRITRLPVSQIPLGEKNSRDTKAIVSLKTGETIAQVRQAL